MTNTMITALVGIVNFVSTLVGLVLLVFFGRKTLMVIFNVCMSFTLMMLAYFAFHKNSIGMITCVLLFIAFFEFSSGPIVWLYNAEIMQDKALSIATFLNWSISLLISIIIPLIIKKVSIGSIFTFFAFCTFLGTLFVIFFMEETMGKSQAEIDAMFRSDDVADDDLKME